jgi:uncharacterized membrane protein YbjE (DUF340 family)
VSFDPFLYVAFAIGYVAGLLTKWRSPHLPEITAAVVVALVFLLGGVLGATAGLDLWVIPLAIGFALLILGLTAVIALVLPRPAQPPAESATSPPSRIPLSAVLVVALLVGFAIGRTTPLPSATLLPFALYVLLALVAFDIRLPASALRALWAPLTAAVAGAVLAAFLFAALTGIGWLPSLATTLGFGFYTLTGPLVTARFGATLGLLAFLANFLRENFTMLAAPYVGRRVRGEGLSAMGGATAMDTTLYFVVRYGDRDAAGLALATGLVLTVAATIVLPLLVGAL